MNQFVPGTRLESDKSFNKIMSSSNALDATVTGKN